MESPDPFSLLPMDEFLSIQIAGHAGVAERFLVVGRPYDGLVRVREWTTHTYASAGDDFEIEAQELLADIENAHAAGLGVRPELYEIRRWLGS